MELTNILNKGFSLKTKEDIVEFGNYVADVYERILEEAESLKTSKDSYKFVEADLEFYIGATPAKIKEGCVLNSADCLSHLQALRPQKRDIKNYLDLFKGYCGLVYYFAEMCADKDFNRQIPIKPKFASNQKQRIKKGLLEVLNSRMVYVSASLKEH